LLRRRAPRGLGVGVVMVGDSFVLVGRGCKDQQLAGTHCTLEALHSTAGTCSYTAVEDATDEPPEQGDHNDHAAHLIELPQQNTTYRGIPV
jgi:hypothetical protein